MHPGSPAPRRAATLLAAMLLLAAACSRKAEETPTPRPSAQPESLPVTPAPPESAAAAPESTVVGDTAIAAPPPARYVAMPILGQKRLAALEDSLGRGRFQEVLKLNRIDLAHARDRDSLVVPSGADSFLALSPFPQHLAAADSLPKLVLVSRRVQAVAAYANGTLLRWAPTSTGREESPTPEGLLHTNWRQKERNSTFNDEWHLKWYLNLENWSGVSIHEYELPGRPASHACVRLLADDAEWFYGWADTWTLSENRRSVTKEGTPVVVFGDWSYGQRPPWKRLPEDAAATDVSVEEVEAAMQKFMPGGAR